MAPLQWLDAFLPDKCHFFVFLYMYLDYRIYFIEEKFKRKIENLRCT
jgi:hypothetical protein